MSSGRNYFSGKRLIVRESTPLLTQEGLGVVELAIESRPAARMVDQVSAFVTALPSSWPGLCQRLAKGTIRPFSRQ